MHYKAVELTEYLWWKGHKSCISIARMNLHIQSASLFEQFAHLNSKPFGLLLGLLWNSTSHRFTSGKVDGMQNGYAN